MAELFSRWESGLQVTAGTMVGSVDGASGLNNYVDRLNSITDDDGVVNATSMISPKATTTSLGAASFNTNDFTVSTGAVSLKSKTSYWSCLGTNFVVSDVETQNPFYSNAGHMSVDPDGIMTLAPVSLPHGAVVTAVVVYGSATDETWSLWRRKIDGSAGGAEMATANIDTQDTSIANATVDNITYAYLIFTSTIDTNDEIDGARITYTTDYD